MVDALLDVGIGFCAFMVASTAICGIERDWWLLLAMAGLIVVSLLFKACRIGRGMLSIEVTDGFVDCVVPDREGRHHCTSTVRIGDVSGDDVTVLSCGTCSVGRHDVLVARCGRRVYGFCNENGVESD